MAFVMHVHQEQAGVRWLLCLLAVVDYEALRGEAARAAKANLQTVREYVAKLGKAQRAAEETLEM